MHGLNSAHGLGLSGMAACGAGRTGLLAVVTARWPRAWRRCRSGGPSAARSWGRAPRLSGGGAGQGERRWGSPRAAVDCEAGWRRGPRRREGRR
jgi:hypothetical protein